MMLKVFAVVDGEAVKKLPRGFGRLVKNKIFLPCRYETNSEGRIRILDQEILDRHRIKPNSFLINFVRIRDISKGFTVVPVGDEAKPLRPYFQDEKVEKYSFRDGYTIFVHKSGVVRIWNVGLPTQNRIPYFRETEIFSDKLPLEWGEEAVKAVLSPKFQPFLSAIMAVYEELTPNGKTLSNGIRIKRDRK